jgi:Tol biopolymer transport system component
LGVLVGCGLAVGSLTALAEQTQNESLSLFGKENAVVLFGILVGEKGSLASITFNTLKSEKTISDQQGGMQVFLSPNRQSLAVTVQLNEEKISTYITDISGNTLVQAYPGSFVSWSPDSQKVLLFLSGDKNPTGRRIYYLGVNGTYQDSGLPEGTISADISPKDSSIAYSVTDPGIDSSNIYLKDSSGNTKLLVRGESDILGWIRWSPDGNRIAFMRSDKGISSGRQNLWLMNADGDNLQKISNITWNYPLTWSPSGLELAFTNLGNVWKFDLSKSTLEQLTNLDSTSALHPTYSEDGKTIIFSAFDASTRQIWSVRNGVTTKLTNSSQNKDYPVLP